MSQQLNLANIASLRSSDLEGLAQPDDLGEGPSQLVHLNLNNTSVDDMAAPHISACVHLQTLELASTKFTSTLFTRSIGGRIMRLNLSFCSRRRSIPDHRRL